MSGERRSRFITEVGPSSEVWLSVTSDDRWVAGQVREDIVTIGDPALKRLVRQVERFDDASRQLCDHMVSRLRELRGAGLAAPQIGHSTAAAVIEVRKTDVFPDRPESSLIVMVNPVITSHSETYIDDWEGCFSVPGIMGIVPRYSQVSVRFQDYYGDVEEATYSGYIARVVQHEIDHLNATIFVDRMPSMSSLTTVENYLAHHRSSPAPV